MTGDTKSNCLSLTQSISQSMGNGQISLLQTFNGIEYLLSLKLEYPAISVTDDLDTTLALTITVGWMYNDPNLDGAPLVPDTSPILEDVAIDAGIAVLAIGAFCLIAFIFPLVVTALAAVAAFVGTLSGVLAFLETS